MKPYFQDETKFCECGCGKAIIPARRFISGHNLIGLPRTEEHRRKIGIAQRKSWQTSQRRLPIGSKNLDHNGYVRVKVVEGAGKWVKEHILVAEQILGRSLLKSELVHHINGNRKDNRPENLFVCRNLVHHNEVHRSQDRALRALLAAGLVIFREGKYEAILPRP